jgi:hypothetical protein
MSMGRTIPAFRIASEIEILKWRPFRKLLDKQGRKVFGEMCMLVGTALHQSPVGTTKIIYYLLYIY